MNHIRHDFNEAAGFKRWKRGFDRAFDALTSRIWFGSEAESVEPQNVQKTKEAFNQFFDDMGWVLPKWCFEELLVEKKGEFEFRADHKTPNWYHEARQCLYHLSFVRDGLLKEKDLRPYGGTEVGNCITFRHDSWEDLGKNKISIYAPLEKNIHVLGDEKNLGDIPFFALRRKAVLIVEGVDLLTRKVPRIDEDGNFVRKDTGKFVKDDRFGGQLNLYYNQVLKSPLTALGKFFDGIEGMSTRVGVTDFSVDDDRKYTDERRMLYGRRKLDTQAIEKFPFLQHAIETADDMLGTLLVAMETLNDYAPDKGENPEHATAMRIDEYKMANKGFRRLPPAFHPITIFMERMWAKAARENDGRVDLIISRAMLPSLADRFGQVNIYRGLPKSLPEQTVSAPNIVWTEPPSTLHKN